MTTQKQIGNKKTTKRRTTKKKSAEATRVEAKKAPTPEARYCMIAEAAYLIAEARDFQGGSAEQDWLQAEQSVDAQILASR